MAQGDEVEEHVRRIAALLGVPDFVYRPVISARGSARREVSDGLLVAGNDGLILQTKSRERGKGLADNPERAIGWCRKKGDEGQRQARGTRRALIPGGMVMRSLRGFERSLPPIGDWPAVVIVDHPLDPAVQFEPSPDTLFVSLADWRWLHDMLRSTAGVIDYVRRVLASTIQVPLGHEQERYAVLAAADAAYAGQRATAVPLLPGEPLSPDDARAATFFDHLIEKVADPVGAVGWDEQEYLVIVESLDRFAPLSRASAGRKMLATIADAVNAKARRSFILADRESGRRLAFLVDHHSPEVDGVDGEEFVARIAAYGALRQMHAIDLGASVSTSTLAVGILMHPQLGTRYAFAFLEGVPPPMPDDLRSALEGHYGVFTGGAVIEAAST